MEPRKHHRFPVELNSYFVTDKADEGLGVVTDLSAGGCRITSRTRGWPGSAVRLRISSAELTPHIHVSTAQVRWARGGQFGLEFKELNEEENGRLQQALSEFEKLSHPS